MYEQPIKKNLQLHILFFTSRPHGDHVSVTPILGILVAIGCGLALVAVAIILVLKFRPSHSGYPSSGQGAGTTHRRHKGGLISDAIFKFGPNFQKTKYLKLQAHNLE